MLVKHLDALILYCAVSSVTLSDTLDSSVWSVTILGSLSRDVFERCTSTGSELFSLLVCLDANKFVLLSFFSPLKTIYSRVSTKPLPNDAKSSLPVDVRRSKTLLLKLPIKYPWVLPVGLIIFQQWYCFLNSFANESWNHQISPQWNVKDLFIH